jgi:hypothetical protein
VVVAIGGLSAVYRYYRRKKVPGFGKMSEKNINGFGSSQTRASGLKFPALNAVSKLNGLSDLHRRNGRFWAL